MDTNTIIFLAVVGVLIFYIIYIYNTLVTYRNRFKNAFAQIDVQLQRRYDLIPNLVDTVKKYMSHEQETLTAVIAARNTAISAKDTASAHPDDASAIQSLMGAEAALTKSMGSFLALAENYPDLKANQTMQQLMEELSSTENKVSFARQAYNDAVLSYNNAIEVFPNSMIASRFAFKQAAMFEVENQEAKKAVKVEF